MVTYYPKKVLKFSILSVFTNRVNNFLCQLILNQNHNILYVKSKFIIISCVFVLTLKCTGATMVSIAANGESLSVKQ